VDPRAAKDAGETIDLIANLKNMHLLDPETDNVL
jgi:hypothetical protein